MEQRIGGLATSAVNKAARLGGSCELFGAQVDLGQLERDIAEFAKKIFYSSRYSDNNFEYRHVILPKELAKYYKADRLLSEDEWRQLGIQQSPGWIHYMIHKPEPHIMLFRRVVPRVNKDTFSWLATRDSRKFQEAKCFPKLLDG